MLNLFFLLLLIILLNINCFYFELNKNQQKCFFAFEDVENYGIVKYLINNNNKLLPKQIQIKVYNINDLDNKNIIFRHIINSNKKGKFLLKIENKNGYKICIHNIYFNDIIKF